MTTWVTMHICRANVMYHKNVLFVNNLNPVIQTMDNKKHFLLKYTQYFLRTIFGVSLMVNLFWIPREAGITRVRKVGCFSILLNLEILFCRIFDYTELLFLLCQSKWLVLALKTLSRCKMNENCTLNCTTH